MLKVTILGVLLTIVLCLAGETATAQAVRVVRQGVKPENSVSSMTVSASPASVNFNLISGGVAHGSNAVQVTTTWSGSLCLLTCSITMYAYFSNSSSALSSGSPPVTIPSSEILGQVTTGIPTAYTAFAGTSPFGGAGASLELYQQSFFILTGGGSRTDALNLEIDLSGQPQLPAGTYTGVLYIQAQSL